MRRRRAAVTNVSRAGRAGRVLAHLSLSAALVFAAVALLAGPAYRHEFLSLGTAFTLLRSSALALLGSAAAGLLAVLLLLASRRRGGGMAAAVLAVLVGAGAATPPLLLYAQSRDLPPIHDISTDIRNPPAFVAIQPLRRMTPNGNDYPLDSARLQKGAYPDIRSFEIATPPTETFERALRAAKAMRWQIVSVGPADGRIEATTRTMMFGFVDDVVIRVRPTPKGSAVDVRSASRVGRGDMGANARRIRAFFREFADAGASG